MMKRYTVNAAGDEICEVDISTPDKRNAWQVFWARNSDRRTLWQQITTGGFVVCTECLPETDRFDAGGRPKLWATTVIDPAGREFASVQRAGTKSDALVQHKQQLADIESWHATKKQRTWCLRWLRFWNWIFDKNP